LRNLTPMVMWVKNAKVTRQQNTVVGAGCGVADCASRLWRRLRSMPLNWKDSPASGWGIYPWFWAVGRGGVWKGSELEHSSRSLGGSVEDEAIADDGGERERRWGKEKKEKTCGWGTRFRTPIKVILSSQREARRNTFITCLYCFLAIVYCITCIDYAQGEFFC